jgi:predicted nucleic acid-binding Zn finger protein
VPSQREIWTVVGSEGDFLVEYDPEGRIQPFCSCDDFHFRVLGGSIAECYHLIATRKAKETNRFSTITFSDEEFKPFLRALIDDVFANIK